MNDDYKALIAEARAAAEKQYLEKQGKANDGDRKLVRFFLCVLVIGITAFYYLQIRPWKKYSSAVFSMNEGDYLTASTRFSSLGNYRDSEQMIIECKAGEEYLSALDLMDKQNYEKAAELFTELEGFKDSREKALEAKKLQLLLDSERLIDRDNYEDALLYLEQAQKIENVGYDDRMDSLLFTLAKKAAEKGDWIGADTALRLIKDEAVIDESLKSDILQNLNN